MRLISLSVRDFALPVPRVGSIEVLSGYGRPADAIEIHQKIQKERAAEFDHYEAEVAIRRDFERGGYTFRVGGRMDGYFAPSIAAGDPQPAKIEEIKTTFNLSELSRRLSSRKAIDHPYLLQLRTYGYFHWLEHRARPELAFCLVSTRNGGREDLPVAFDAEDIEIYEAWLERRLDELVIETDEAVARAERRKKVARKLRFPFASPRPGQVDLIRTIEAGMGDGKRMLMQAPTGLGKTAGVLFPVLQDALGRGERVVYVTPKNSQHTVAEDAVERLQEQGAKVRSLTITAKSKICFKNEPLCNPEFCEYAKDHYTKVDENKLRQVAAKKKKLTARVFRAIAEEHQVCPFELQLEAAADADVVICDYNYVFAPRSAFGRLSAPGLVPEDLRGGKPNLVIDEAHNLPARAMDYFSPALSTVTLERMREPLGRIPARFRDEADRLLNGCIETVLACRPPMAQEVGFRKGSEIEPPAGPFLEQDGQLRAFLSRYLESDVDIQPKDPVLRLCFYWSEFTAALGFVKDPAREEFFTTYHPAFAPYSRPDEAPIGGTVKITCCDASSFLKASYDEYGQVVAFSATLKPFDYYARLSGLDPAEVRTAEFTSPFPRGHRKLMIIPQISTKYAERERSLPKITEAIQRIVEVRPGNYFAFFPSFEFMDKAHAAFRPPPGFTVLRQARESRAADVEALQARLRESTEPTLIFAVQGGVLSEGVDYPGDMIIGAFVIGPPLPVFDLEREGMRDYYDDRYGAGFDYAYAFPAMAKAIQAAGRVIRSETDRGLIVLLDNRFLDPSYAQSMPADWFIDGPRELVSRSILKDVADFWQAAETRADGLATAEPAAP